MVGAARQQERENKMSTFNETLAEVISSPSTFNIARLDWKYGDTEWGAQAVQAAWGYWQAMQVDLEAEIAGLREEYQARMEAAVKADEQVDLSGIDPETASLGQVSRMMNGNQDQCRASLRQAIANAKWFNHYSLSCDLKELESFFI